MMAEKRQKTRALWVFAMFVVLMMLANSVSGQENKPSLDDCAKLKEGTFQIDDKENGLSVITRKAGIQREENEQMGIIVEYLTEWIDACNYRLVPFKVIKNDNNLDMDADLKLNITIMEIHEKHYVQVTYSQATGKTEVEDVQIIK